MKRNKKVYAAISILLIASVILSACSVALYPDDSPESEIVLYSDGYGKSEAETSKEDNGYDVSDYYEIDEMYGTMEDMDRL